MNPPFKRCLFILADGARPDVMLSLAAKGELPNISRHLIDKGTAETMLTAFPSTTGAAYLPYLTGCHPGTCNVPGIRWFDKGHYAQKGWSFKSFRSYVGLETFLFNYDMRPEIKTVFQIYDRPVSAFNMVNRGVKHGHNKTKYSRIWYVYYAHLTDHWNFVDQVTTRKVISSLDENPDFIFAVYPAIDEYAHRSSPFHPRTLEAYRELDAHIGTLCNELQKRGWLDETLLVIASDHGLSETTRHFDVGPWLEEKGMKSFYYTQIFKRNFVASSMVSGNGMCHLYFKNDQGWKDRTYFEELSHKSLLLDELRMRPEVDLVAVQSASGAFVVLTKKGMGQFKVDGDQVYYEWKTEEPLGLGVEKGVHSLTMTMDESYHRTFNSHYPDVFYQLAKLFASPRCGDVIISAATGSDLRERYEHPEHKASHGAICPEHMKVPLVMNYPLPKGQAIRSMDVFPTILKLTGKEIPEGIDGRSLV